MTIIRLQDKTLWIHAPLALDEDLKTKLQELGEVKHIVTPNFEHMGFAEQVCIPSQLADTPLDTSLMSAAAAVHSFAFILGYL